MEAIPFYIKRKQLANKVLNETDEEILDRLTIYFQQLRPDYELFHISDKDLKDTIRRSEIAFEEGQFISHEEMRRKHPRL